MRGKNLAIAVVVPVLLTVLLIAACYIAIDAMTAPVESEDHHADASMFVEVEYVYGWRVVYHRETKVMYAVSTGSHSIGEFTLLVNPDGTPMVWEGE